MQRSEMADPASRIALRGSRMRCRRLMHAGRCALRTPTRQGVMSSWNANHARVRGELITPGFARPVAVTDTRRV